VEKTHQVKYSNPPYYSSKDFKPSSSKDHKISSFTNVRTHASPFSPPKSKIEKKTSGLKCFKFLDYGHKASYCPNQRVMVLKNGEVEFKPLLILLLLLLFLFF